MNLRSNRRVTRREFRRRSEPNVFLSVIFYLFIIGSLSFSVFGMTAYYDGKSQKINKEIALDEVDIYKFDREIQNLKVKIESKSRKVYVVSKLNTYNIGLKTPDPEQIIHLKTISYKGMENAKSDRNSEVAYNF